jgi:hypothetical protein
MNDIIPTLLFSDSVAPDGARNRCSLTLDDNRKGAGKQSDRKPFEDLGKSHAIQ